MNPFLVLVLVPSPWNLLLIAKDPCLGSALFVCVLMFVGIGVFAGLTYPVGQPREYDL